MDTTVENITGFTPDRKTMLPIPLPVDLHDWATRHEPLISRLSQSITVTSTPLSENALWNSIAENFSGDWKEKHAELLRTEKRLAQLMAPENMPLGLVGGALHSDETNDAERKHTLALADFTIVNETLRQEPGLNKLLGALLQYQHTLSKSLDLSKTVASASAAFDTVAAPEFASAKKPATGLSLSFKSIAAKLLKKPAQARKPNVQSPSLT